MLDSNQKNNSLYTADMDQMILSTSISEKDENFISIDTLDAEISKLLKIDQSILKAEIDTESKAISENHFILRCGEDDPQYIEILALKDLYLNNKLLTRDDGFQKLQNLDDVRIDGSQTSIPHIWKFVQIQQIDESQHMGVYDSQETSRIQPFIKEAIHEVQNKVMADQRKAYTALNKEIRRKNGLSCESILDGINYGQHCTSIFKKYPDIALHKSWSSMEKETLKKYLL